MLERSEDWALGVMCICALLFVSAAPCALRLQDRGGPLHARIVVHAAEDIVRSHVEARALRASLEDWQVCRDPESESGRG